MFDTKLKPSKSFRKVTKFGDAEDKVRVVAIGEYWSQTCLQEIHEWSYKVLRLLRQDCTYSQSMPNLLNQGIDRTYYCFDLVSFTDRMPILIILRFLYVIMPKDKADAWYNIMVGYPFDFKESKESPPSKLIYEVGTPMGFLSSWGLSTLLHHFCLFQCCLNLNKNFKTAEFYLLGDDIVIYDDGLASEYVKVMLSLGVEISAAKTLKSNKIYEFAKRVFTPNGEVSPVSTKGFLEHSKSYTAFYQFLVDLRKRGYNFNYTLPETAIRYYTTFHNHAIKRNYLWKVFSKVAIMNKRISGIANDLELINNVLMTLALETLNCNQYNIATAMLQNTIVIMLTDSVKKFTGDSQDRIYDSIIVSSCDVSGEYYLDRTYSKYNGRY